MNQRQLLRHPVAHHLFAVALVTLTAALRLGPFESSASSHPWLTFCPAVLIAAFFGGLFPGLLATALSCVAVTFALPFFTGQPFIETNGHWPGMIAFILTGSMMSAVCENTRRSKARVDVYHTLIESLDEGFCVIEVLYDRTGKPDDYRFIEYNPSFEHQTGLRDAIGKTMRSLVPDHDEHWFETYGKVARTGVGIRFESPATAMKKYYDVFAFRVGGDKSNKVGILFSDISERKKNELELINAAHYDELTGLANRAMFRQHLSRSIARAERGKQTLALLFLDLDGFKEVNDSLGHQAGDDLLCSVAQRLVANLRTEDLASRFGGDEFAVILDNCRPDYLPALADALIQRLELPIELDDGTARISASIGIVTYPECGTDAETLLQRADATMYAVKKDGKRGFKLWNSSINRIGN